MLFYYTKLNLKVNLCGADFSFCLSGAEKKAIASKYPNVLVYLKEGKTGINAFRVDKVTAKRLTKLYGVIVQ